MEAELIANLDPHRLLEGEDPESTDPEAARRWVGVYSELLAFKQEVASRTRAELERLPAAGKREIEFDLALVERQTSRLESRLSFWRQRQLDQRGLLDGDEQPRLSVGGRTSRISRRERQLLAFLVANPEKPFRASALAARAWRDPGLSPAQVRTYVSRLREKLVKVEAPCRIEASPGSGYRLTWSDGAGKGPSS